MGVSKASGEPTSRQIRGPWRGLASRIVEPPFDFNALAKFLEINTEHLRCVRSKAADVAGQGYQLQAREQVDEQGNPIEPDPRHRAELEEFFSWPNEEQTFRDLIEILMVDYEALGNCYLEIVRKVDGTKDPPWGKPVKIYHVPARTVRILRDGSGFVQIRGSQRRFFKRYGDRRVMDCRDGRFATSGLPAEYHATEIVHFRRYHPSSDWYGVPDFLPAAAAILGNVRASEFNISFFENRAVPDTVVIVEGGVLGEEDKEYVRKFFEEELRGATRQHKTLILETQGEPGERPPAIKVEPLSKSLQEGHFLQYRKDNRDEIIRAHEVPPARVSIIETANLGSGSGLVQYQIYKQTVVEPRQQMLQHFFNRRVIWDEEDGFGYTDWELRFVDLDLSDQEVRSRIDRRYLDARAVTINEVRRERGLPEVEGGDELWIPLGRTVVFVDELPKLRQIPLEQRLALGVGPPPRTPVEEV